VKSAIFWAFVLPDLWNSEHYALCHWQQLTEDRLQALC